MIASGEVRLISVRMSKTKYNKDVMILPETVQIKGCSLESGLYVVKKNEINIQVKNATNTSKSLLKGALLYKAEVYDKQIRETKAAFEVDQVIGLLNKEGIEKQVQREEAYRMKAAESDFEQAKKPLFELLSRFRDVVAISGDKLGCTNVLKHTIRLETGTAPIYVPAYRIPEKHKTAVT